VLTLLLFRSAPSNQVAAVRRPFEWKLLADVEVWCFAFLWSGFVVGIRIAQIWIAVYAADLYISTQGLALNQAVVRGGVLALLAFSLVGRAIGCPLAGRLSDMLVKRGVSRPAVLIGWLLLSIVLFHLLGTGVTSIALLAVIAAILGMSINLFSIVPAAINDRFGAQRTASLSAFANTMAQLAGATALALSGYVGISMNAQPGNALTEYRGIWLCAEVGMGIMTLLAIVSYVAVRKLPVIGSEVPVQN
jgi:MFS family permease